ncbi:MAG: hypothetical protein ACI4JI_01925 [Ruminiclostridium sp.]
MKTQIKIPPNTPFVELTADQIKYLRKLPAVGYATYNYASAEIVKARRHLQSIYPDCTVQTAFAEKMLLLYNLYIKSSPVSNQNIHNDEINDENRGRYERSYKDAYI